MNRRGEREWEGKGAREGKSIFSLPSACSSEANPATALDSSPHMSSYPWWVGQCWIDRWQKASSGRYSGEPGLSHF